MGTWQFGDAHGFQFAVGGLIGALTLAAGLQLLFAGGTRRPCSTCRSRLAGRGASS
jgi:hypothetical protein